MSSLEVLYNLDIKDDTLLITKIKFYCQPL